MAAIFKGKSFIPIAATKRVGLIKVLGPKIMRPDLLKKPRSVWPKGSLKVTGWHRDEHLTLLFRESDQIAAAFPRVSPGCTLPSIAIVQLCSLATSTDSPYVATAAMDHLFDAYESFPEIIQSFEQLLSASQAKAVRKRVVACLRFLLGDGSNRRPIIGRSFQEVEGDFQHFQGLLNRVAKLELFAGTT